MPLSLRGATIGHTVRGHTAIVVRNCVRNITTRPYTNFKFPNAAPIHIHTNRSDVIVSIMGKKKSRGEYNDFLDGEKLRDNAEIRTSLQGSTTIAGISPLPSSQHHGRGSETKGQGKGRLQKPPLTHFLCIPLVTERSKSQLQDGLEKFKKELGKENVVPIKAVRPLGTLHLTLGVMSVDEGKVEELQQYLQDLDLHSMFRDISLQRLAEDAAESGIISENFNAAVMPESDVLTINLESLVPMQSPSNTSILYADPRDDSRRLYAFTSELRKRFTTAKYMVEDARPLKLHATILNTIYAKSGGRRRTSKSGNAKTTSEHNDGGVPPTHDGVDKNRDLKSSGHSTNNHEEPATAEGQQIQAKSEGHGTDSKNWMRFDARGLITTFHNFVWAESIQIDRVHICKMGAKKIWSGVSEGEGEVIDEQYEVVASKSILN